MPSKKKDKSAAPPQPRADTDRARVLATLRNTGVPMTRQELEESLGGRAIGP